MRATLRQNPSPAFRSERPGRFASGPLGIGQVTAAAGRTRRPSPAWRQAAAWGVALACLTAAASGCGRASVLAQAAPAPRAVVVRSDPGLTLLGLPGGPGRFDPAGIALSPRGTVWFTEMEANRIGRLDPATRAMRTYPAPERHAYPLDVAVGGGAVFFTEGQGVGRIAPRSGAVREYRVSGGPQLISSLAVGADGRVWFADSVGDRIGVLQPTTGAVRLYHLPSGSNPSDIIVDAAGRPWFTEYGRDRLGTLDPVTGRLREWRLPVPGYGGPGAIALASHGVLWFTATGDLLEPSAIGRFIPGTGRFSFHRLPPDAGVAEAIAVTPQGGVWFTAEPPNSAAGAGRGSLGYLSPGGTLVLCPLLPGDGGLYAAAADPTGGMWFSEADAGQLGHATPRGCRLRSRAYQAMDANPAM